MCSMSYRVFPPYLSGPTTPTRDETICACLMQSFMYRPREVPPHRCSMIYLTASFCFTFAPYRPRQDSVQNFYVSRRKGVVGLQNMFKGMLS